MTTSFPDIDAALADAVARYRSRNPRSESLLAEAGEVLPGGNTRSVLFHAPFPLTMTRGEGCRLWDADGHVYLDALGEFTAGIYGHSHPAIRQAIVDAVDGGLSLSSHTLREAALAREIRRRFPSMELLRFTNSGTEANLLALAAATAHTQRRKVLADLPFRQPPEGEGPAVLRPARARHFPCAARSRCAVAAVRRCRGREFVAAMDAVVAARRALLPARA